jgi:hypothetical protein
VKAIRSKTDCDEAQSKSVANDTFRRPRTSYRSAGSPIAAHLSAFHAWVVITRDPSPYVTGSDASPSDSTVNLLARSDCGQERTWHTEPRALPDHRPIELGATRPPARPRKMWASAQSCASVAFSST